MNDDKGRTDSTDPNSRSTAAPYKWWRSVFSWFDKFILIPLAGILISSVILVRLTEFWTGPPAYKIYVIGNFSVQSKVADAIWQGFSQKVQAGLKIDGVPIQVERTDDKGNPAHAKNIADKLASRSDTLLVIGHLFSSQTQAALPAYLDASPPIPVILTVETNPHLVPLRLTDDLAYYPLFRLSPTDKEQAHTAAQFVVRKGKKSLWVVHDAINPAYSDYLVREFIADIQRLGQAVVLTSSISSMPSVETLRQLKIDGVFFAGNWSNALVLTQHIKAGWSQPPLILLSDAAVEEELLQYGHTAVNGVYVSNAMHADQYQKDGYQAYGQDAALIVNDVIADANMRFTDIMKERGWLRYWVKWILKIRRVSDARRAVKAVMERAAIWDLHSFKGVLGEYEFGNDGTRANAAFHIWRVHANKDKQGFREVSQEE